jgi:hypothetical protein
MISTDPFADRTLVGAVKVIVEPVGASRPTLSHAIDATDVAAIADHRRTTEPRGNIRAVNILFP